MFDNEQGITEIKLMGRVRHYCPMGDDWVSTDIEITVTDPATIPDYCDVTAHLKELDGRQIILENLCLDVHRFIKSQTQGYVIVTAKTKDAEHVPAQVTIAK